MHPTISYYLMQARTADLHHRAERDRLARAARNARRGQRRHLVPVPSPAGLARVFAALGVASPRLAQ